MAQTSSSQLTIINADSALRDIAEAESIYDVSALTARILVGVATNSGTSAQHLDKISTTAAAQLKALVASAENSAAKLEQAVKHLQTIATHGTASHPLHITLGG